MEIFVEEERFRRRGYRGKGFKMGRGSEGI